MNRIALLALVSLSACTGIQPGPPYWDVRHDAAIWDRVERRPYLPQDRLIVACVRYNGIFTRDKQACLVRGRGVCYYVTAPGDTGHDEMLTAYCNGFRPDHY